MAYVKVRVSIAEDFEVWCEGSDAKSCVDDIREGGKLTRQVMDSINMHVISEESSFDPPEPDDVQPTD